jgi:hypothetical protein
LITANDFVAGAGTAARGVFRPVTTSAPLRDDPTLKVKRSMVCP